jgi:GMP synthase-like glutamine amidotransferase
MQQPMLPSAAVAVNPQPPRRLTRRMTDRLPRPPRLLVVESEDADDREARRRSAGKSAGESYAATLEQMVPGAAIDRVAPSDGDDRVWAPDRLGGYDGVFVSGSPLHVYCATAETERQLAFMRHVFAAGVPAFGSCAGLQVAVAAAGGRVRRMPHRQEAGIGRRIVATEAGRGHPLLAGRAAAWDALSIHGDEVEALPDGATLLASNAAARVQAAEVRVGNAVFWGVQYHPELAPGEIAAALRRQKAGLVDDGLVDDEAAVEAQAELLDRLHRDPDHRETRWRLGVGGAVAREAERRTELRNFLDHLVLPRVRAGQPRRVPAGEPAQSANSSTGVSSSRFSAWT